MKRYASHFLFLPGYGYLRQFAVETRKGRAVRIFPLSEEMENTEWLPGVILLLNEDIRQDITSYESYFNTTHILPSVPESLSHNLEDGKERPVSFIPYLLFPFDFTMMQPVAGTRHRQLR